MCTFEKDTPSEHEQQSTVALPENWPDAGQMIFDNIWATYDDKEDGLDGH